MAMLVQATCPGCKKLLHIPAEWLSQPIKCKFCGLIMAARPQQPAGRQAPPASSKTPMPASRPAKVLSPPPLPSAVKAPPSLPHKAPPALPPLPPVPSSRKATPPSISYPRLDTPPSIPVLPPGPVSGPPPIPAPQPAPCYASSPDPFATLQGDGEPVLIRPSLRRGSWWKGPLVFLLFLGLLGGGGYYAWPQVWPLIRAKFQERDTQVAQADETEKPREKKPKKDKKDREESEKPANTDPPRTDPVKDPVKNPDPMRDPVKPPKDPVKDPVKPVDPPKDPVKPPKDPIKEPFKPVDPPRDPVKPPPPPPPVAGAPFPRRALVISVHDYIFANASSPTKNATWKYGLTNGLKIPPSQIFHLSDHGFEANIPPMRLTIEETLKAFLDTSRAQDRIMVFFIGHAVEIEGKGYLVPMEGDPSKPETLIELEWVLKRMADCKARQKVLVLDGNRFSPTLGEERPGPGPMSEKMDALLKNPPAGVQIWQTCIAGEKSYVTDSLPMGQFLGSLDFEMTPTFGDQQKPEDPFPLEKLNDHVTRTIKKDLATLKLVGADGKPAVQTPRLNGSEAAGGKTFDLAEAAPPKPVAVIPPNQNAGVADKELVKSVFLDLSVPPVKVTKTEAKLRYDLPFSQMVMDAYKADDKPNSELRKAVLKARAALWAISAQNDVPSELRAEADSFRKELGVDLKEKVDYIQFNANEMQFKGAIETRQRKISKMLTFLNDVYDDLKEAKKLRKDETKRWQANYDFTLARLEEQMAHLWEYTSMLGQMRKEAPPKEAFHTGWILASTTDLSGDSNGKKLAASAQKLLDQIAADYAGTPWEMLAKREKFTALGLEWKPTKQ